MPVHGFAPVSSREAQVLVLGTMPGKESLRLGQYYGHPRNSFWSLAGEVLGFDPSLSYSERIARLTAAKVALWDVLQLCTRESSLDSDIVDPVANNFATFFEAHPEVARVCFNGSAAEDLFHEHVLEDLKLDRSLEYRRLPSTSPANASVSRAAKLESWRAIKL